ncbi:MAG: SHD1 domain-containing protein [Mariniblastus sp.]
MIRKSTTTLLMLIASSLAISSSYGQQLQTENQLGPARIWSDDSGTFSIEARLLKINDASVTLRKTNNVVIEVPFARLSKGDAKFVKGLMASEPATNTHTPNVKLSGPSATENTRNGTSRPAPVTAEPERAVAPPTNDLQSRRLALEPEGRTRGNYLGKTNGSKADLDAQTMTFPQPNLNYRSNVGLNNSKTGLPEITKIEFDSKTASRNAGGNSSKNDGESDSIFSQVPQTSPRTTFGTNSTILVSIPTNVLQAVPANLQPTARMIAEATDHATVRKGIRQLRSVTPPSNSPAVLEIVRRCAVSKDSSTRRLVIDYLAAADPQNNLGLILSGINDSNFDVRWIAYRSLEKIGDTRVIPELAKRFAGEDRAQIMLVLSKLGGASEPYVVPYLKNESSKVQLSACSLLGQIGGQNALQSLAEISNLDGVDAKVRLQATNSINMIQKRVRTATAIGGRNQIR